MSVKSAFKQAAPIAFEKWTSNPFFMVVDAAIVLAILYWIF